jgi:hypothetical protein
VARKAHLNNQIILSYTKMSVMESKIGMTIGTAPGAESQDSDMDMINFEKSLEYATQNTKINSC